MTSTDAIAMLSSRLANQQFAPGLWGYTSAQFATEPTCFALMAFRDTFNRGDVRMLVDYQRPDGFWPAADRGSAPSTWVTAFAVNTLLKLSPGNRGLSLGLKALLNAKPQEAFWFYRLSTHCSPFPASMATIPDSSGS